MKALYRKKIVLNKFYKYYYINILKKEKCNHFFPLFLQKLKRLPQSGNIFGWSFMTLLIILRSIVFLFHCICISVVLFIDLCQANHLTLISINLMNLESLEHLSILHNSTYRSWYGLLISKWFHNLVLVYLRSIIRRRSLKSQIFLFDFKFN